MNKINRLHLQSLPRKNQVTTLVLSGKTYQQIATELGISRQRVQQLNKPNASVIDQLKLRSKNRCEYCGIMLQKGHTHHISEKVSTEDYNKLTNLKYLCISCHKRVDAKRKYHTCRQCNKSFYNGKFEEQKHRSKFCSNECQYKYHHKTLTCCICNKVFDITNKDYKSRIINKKLPGFFCSKICYGKWYGNNYGFGSANGYKNIQYGKVRFKIDRTELAEMYKLHPASVVAKKLGISPKTVYTIASQLGISKVRRRDYER